jgi:hypothetical protein
MFPEERQVERGSVRNRQGHLSDRTRRDISRQKRRPEINKRTRR